MLTKATDDHAWPENQPYLHASIIRPYPLLDVEDLGPVIATQSPQPVMFDNFLEALWCQDVNLIVNLTSCMEHGQHVADRYWPTLPGQRTA